MAYFSHAVVAQTIIPELIVQTVAVISGSMITIGIPALWAKLNKVSKLYTTVFGIEEVEDMSGLVGVVESHDSEIGSQDERIEKLKNNQESLIEGQESIKQRISKLEQSIKDRNDGTDPDT